MALYFIRRQMYLDRRIHSIKKGLNRANIANSLIFVVDRYQDLIFLDSIENDNNLTLATLVKGEIT
jgi:hypothetical protein